MYYLLVCYLISAIPEEATGTLSLNLEIRQQCQNFKLLSNRRRSISLDPILWLLICLDIHRHLFMPETIRGPLSFLSNMLPLPLTWSQRWPTIYSVLYELDQLYHNKLISNRHSYGQNFLVWLNQSL
ncbi:hypothetical protein BCV72DRAFT_256073 [Rhizopus microsporus var. microsporus]|uniref:Uncharacterized protein n=1 Tax=Rhizopus microsporus var. microsporus TaxID=86635 RepID=A0A1X0R4Q2_RHIZD|nr:hypothetical protein BCV72DRAFT_256073 [Rhizopus microsporus var. microsporus]